MQESRCHFAFLVQLFCNVIGFSYFLTLYGIVVDNASFVYIWLNVDLQAHWLKLKSYQHEFSTYFQVQQKLH